MTQKSKTRQKWIPLWCQCLDCLETFELDGVVNGGHLIRLEEHRRVIRSEDGHYYHRCGGNGHTRGRLGLYPILKFWRS